MAVVATLDVILRALTNKYDRSLDKSRKQTTAFVKTLRGVGAVSAALGSTALLGSAVQSTRNFQNAFAKSTAIMGDLSDKLRMDLESTARSVARTTVFSSAQAAEAYFFLASAGLDATQSIAALPAVARFAEAGTFDLAQATDLLTDAQSALGLSTKDAAQNLQNMKRVSDVLVKANTLANASVEQFSQALTTKAAAALRQLGISVEEGVAVLAAFADQGIKASDAGTALNIVLRDLTTKALENQKAFEKHGIAVFDSAGEIRNLGDIIEDIEGALDGMSDRTRKATLLQLGFTDKSVAFISALIGMSEKIKDYEEGLSDANGVTDDIANKTIPAFERALSRLTEVFDKWSNSSLAPALEFLAKMADALTAIEGLINRLTKSDIGKFLFRPALQNFAELNEALDIIDKKRKEFKAARVPVVESASDIIAGLRAGSGGKGLPTATTAEGQKALEDFAKEYPSEDEKRSMKTQELLREQLNNLIDMKRELRKRTVLAAAEL